VCKVDDRPRALTTHGVTIVRSSVSEGFVVGARERAGKYASMCLIEASMDSAQRLGGGAGNEAGLRPLQKTIETECASIGGDVARVVVVVHVLMLTRMRAASDGTRIVTLTDL
jgi:hypothetical protein